MPKIIENLAHRLTEEARKQVMESGYAAMNIRTVAKNCGVGIGTVYNYFPSKDALIAGFLAEDWRQSLERIRADASGIYDALEAIHRELTDFSARYHDLFRSAAAELPAPPRQYHDLLRGQLAEVLLPFSPDAFTAEFIAEAILTWTIAGVPCHQLEEIIRKLL